MIYMVFQFALVAAVVAFSVWHMVRKFLPKKAVEPSACGSPSPCATCGGCAFANLKSATPPDR